MPLFDALTGYSATPTVDSTQDLPTPNEAYSGQIQDTALNPDDSVRVTIPAFDDHKFWGPARFMPYAATLPKAGDNALVIFDEEGDPHIVAWEPSGPIDLGGTGTPGPQGPPGPPGQQGQTGGTAYSTTIGDGVSQQFTVTHNLATRNAQVAVYRSAAPYDQVLADIERTTTNAITVRTASAPGANELTVVVSAPGSPATGGSDANYVHNQTILAATWNVAHNLGKFAAVTVVDTGGTEVLPNVTYVDANNLTVSFAAPTSGKVYVN